MKPEIKRVLILSIPYVIVWYFVDKISWLYRMVPGDMAAYKIGNVFMGFGQAFANPLPSLHPIDILVGIVGALFMRFIIWYRAQNAKKFRQGVEYGSARWGTPQDIKPYVDDDSLMINEMFSLNALNHLLRCFMSERIIGNPCYDFAKYAAGIDEFEFVSAGDSRPIAMANLYFQNAGEDICRQLANHVHINTSSGYYTNIYERFNLHHPADFRGHSLSVSDVIVLHKDGKDQAWYVDSFGFKQVPEFFADNPLKKVEELMEDDYGMIDGIINNGDRRKDQEEKKPSVMEKLQEKKKEAAEVEAAKPKTATKSKEHDIS